MFMYELLRKTPIFAFGCFRIKAQKTSSSRRRRRSERVKARWRKTPSEKRKEKKPYLTFKHRKLGTGVDLANTVGGCALVNSFVSVCAQRLDPQYGARAIIKLNHLESRSKTKGQFFKNYFRGIFFISKDLT